MDLDELIVKVNAELKNVHYSDLCLKRFATVWNRLRDYVGQDGQNLYTAKIGMDFLEAEYGITVYTKLTQRNRRCARAVNVLTDYLLHGIIFSRRMQPRLTFHRQFQKVFQGYIDKKKADGSSEDTVRSYEIYLSRFSAYLNSRGIAVIDSLDESVVLGYINTLVKHSPSVIHTTLCALRTFFHYLFQNGFASRNFAYIVPHDGYRKRTKVPSAYPKEDVVKLLKSIDRGNPKGKRDYAIILIAARLGLRAQDICNLSFNNLKWETNTVEIVQEKTDSSLVLPLLEDVGMAIIDYLKYARPQCNSTNAIFLRLVPPIGKLEAPTLHSIVTQHMNNAGIKIQDGKKHGPHALRHSLASALLEENTPLPVIAEILGHRSTATTSTYLQIDINQLRTCTLDPLPFDWEKGEEVF
ncbi:MAG: tyrosine-type recombinase/integrase [Fibrobacter sp.]|jgi:site-specific recombinase XerD|nr:tyrosine-type recombinase/integrase [Fibrobacter sp.]